MMTCSLSLECFATVLMDNPVEFHVEDRAESHVKIYVT